MALNKNKQTGILGGILVFFIPLIVVTYIYVFSSKPDLKMLPVLGQSLVNEEGDSIDYVVRPFDFTSAEGRVINNDTFKKEVKVVTFGSPDDMQVDKPVFDELGQKFVEYPELQFIYHLILPSGSTFVSPPGDINDSFHMITRSDYFGLDQAYLLDDEKRYALVDKENRIRGTYGRSEVNLLEEDIQHMLVENFHLVKKGKRSDRFSREKK